MAFDIVKYLEDNKIKLGSIKKEVGTSISKSGQNDLRKTTYDVKIKDGKFDLSTHKSIMTESKGLISEASDNDSAYICTFAQEKGQFVYTPKALLKWLNNTEASAGSIKRIIHGPFNKTLSNGKDWSDENLDHLESVTRLHFTQ